MAKIISKKKLKKIQEKSYDVGFEHGMELAPLLGNPPEPHMPDEYVEPPTVKEKDTFYGKICKVRFPVIANDSELVKHRLAQVHEQLEKDIRALMEKDVHVVILGGMEFLYEKDLYGKNRQTYCRVNILVIDDPLFTEPSNNEIERLSRMSREIIINACFI